MYRQVFNLIHAYKDVTESTKLPQTGLPIDENSSIYAREHIALGTWVRRELPDNVDNSKFLFSHLALTSLYSTRYLPNSISKLLNESKVHENAPDVYQNIVITPYLLASLSVNGIKIHPSLLLAIPNWWDYMKDLHIIRLTDFSLSELHVIIENYYLANDSLDKLPLMRRKIEKYYPKLHRLFTLPLRCKKDGILPSIKTLYKCIFDDRIYKWLVGYSS